jgi:Ser/Thr protein kinase RdoA (MazF antagonist)
MAKGRRTVLPIPDVSAEPLGGGYKNELLRYGEVVLRLETTTLESATWERGLLEFLAARLPEAVVPLAGPVIWSDGRIATALPFVDGVELDREARGERRELARLLARLHVAGLEWTGGQRPGASSWPERDLVRNEWWDWTIVEKPTALVVAYEELVALLADPPRLREGIVHGDIYRANLLVREQHIVGVIDWEDARVDWPAWELANATWEVCKVGDVLDAARADAFVDAYVDSGGPGETEPLAQLIRCRLVADALYSLTSKARGAAYDQGYVDHLVRALA